MRINPTQTYCNALRAVLNLSWASDCHLSSALACLFLLPRSPVPQSPVAMVILYNHVLDYVAKLLTSLDIVKLSWPVKEFAEAGECAKLI